MQTYLARRLLDLHTQICLHETVPGNIEILGVFVHELSLLESITYGNMHHAINKQAVNNEVIALVFHENRLFYFLPQGIGFSPSVQKCECDTFVRLAWCHSCF